MQTANPYCEHAGCCQCCSCKFDIDSCTSLELLCSTTWQQLKDTFKKIGEVVYCTVFKVRDVVLGNCVTCGPALCLSTLK